MEEINLGATMKTIALNVETGRAIPEPPMSHGSTQSKPRRYPLPTMEIERVLRDEIAKAIAADDRTFRGPRFSELEFRVSAFDALDTVAAAEGRAIEAAGQFVQFLAQLAEMATSERQRFCRWGSTNPLGVARNLAGDVDRCAVVYSERLNAYAFAVRMNVAALLDDPRTSESVRDLVRDATS